MLRFEPVTPDFPDLARFLQLYEDAFPAGERVPPSLLFHRPPGDSSALAFYDGDTFCGLICLLTAGSITHILYFAVCPQLRGRHYGSAVLAGVRARYPQNRIIADLEADGGDAPNAIQRRARIRFYEANGFEKTAVAYRWRREDYVIYALGGTITEAEFDAFWDHF